MTIVCTYFHPLPIPGPLGPAKTLLNAYRQLQMVKLWKQSWRAKGWEPVVLSRRDAFGAQSETALFLQQADTLYGGHGANPRAYEAACYLRWVAMTRRGGMLTDYDAMNRNFRPDDLHRILQSKEPGKVEFLGHGCPCANAGNPEDYQQVVDCFLEFARHPVDSHVQLKQNVSDQNVLTQYMKVMSLHHPVLCPNFGDAGSESSPLVHFPHSVVRTGRVKFIKQRCPELIRT